MGQGRRDGLTQVQSEEKEWDDRRKHVEGTFFVVEELVIGYCSKARKPSVNKFNIQRILSYAQAFGFSPSAFGVVCDLDRFRFRDSPTLAPLMLAIRY